MCRIAPFRSAAAALSFFEVAGRMSVGIDNFMSVPNHCPEPMMGRLSIG